MRRTRNQDRGQVVPLVAFALIPLIGCTAMAVDVGMWRYQQELAQMAADGGARAAAVELENSSQLTALYTAANIDTTANGFAGSSLNGSLNTADNVTVRVTNPPSTGANTTNASAVEVDVSKALPVYFGWWSATVSARAVATTPSSGNCLTALNRQGTVFTLDGGTIDMPNCGMMANGGLLLNGGGTIDANAIGYAGSMTGSATYPKAMPQGTSAVTDPCSTIAGCAYLKANPPAPGSCSSSQVITAPTTINAGTYCNTIFQGSGTVTLNAGLYYFSNGFNINGSVSLAGTGVTLYNASGTMNFGQGTETLVAPTSGTAANVLLVQPASDTNSITFNGRAAAVLTGLLYAPGAQLILDGTSTTLSDIIAGSVLINASGTMTFPTAAGGGASGGLAE
jgi:hypothetical protein